MEALGQTGGSRTDWRLQDRVEAPGQNGGSRTDWRLQDRLEVPAQAGRLQSRTGSLDTHRVRRDNLPMPTFDPAVSAVAVAAVAAVAACEP